MHALFIIAWIFVASGLISTIVVYVDINMGRYQNMAIMNIAWPITCLYSSFLGLFMYFKYGRADKPMMHDHAAMQHEQHDNKKHVAHSKKHAAMQHETKKEKPKWVQIYISSTHCGAGCGLADIVSEFFIYFAGITIFGAVIWASFIIDYVVALIFGFAFQYFNIKPMKPNVPAIKVIWQAITADIWSLTSFQIGMYAWLLVVHFMFAGQLNAGSIIYWFMMQIGLTIGLLTTYPVNYLLLKWGIKEPCAH